MGLRHIIWTVASGRPFAMDSPVSPVATRPQSTKPIRWCARVVLLVSLPNINIDDADELGVWANPKGFLLSQARDPRHIHADSIY